MHVQCALQRCSAAPARQTMLAASMRRTHQRAASSGCPPACLGAECSQLKEKEDVFFPLSPRRGAGSEGGREGREKEGWGCGHKKMKRVHKRERLNWRPGWQRGQITLELEPMRGEAARGGHGEQLQLIVYWLASR